MTSATIKSSAYFEPSAYRKSIAEMFGLLGTEQQRDLIERLAILPRHIHRLATDGLIADQTFSHSVPEPRKTAESRG